MKSKEYAKGISNIQDTVLIDDSIHNRIVDFIDLIKKCEFNYGLNIGGMQSEHLFIREGEVIFKCRTDGWHSILKYIYDMVKTDDFFNKLEELRQHVVDFQDDTVNTGICKKCDCMEFLCGLYVRFYCDFIIINGHRS